MVFSLPRIRRELRERRDASYRHQRLRDERAVDTDRSGRTSAWSARGLDPGAGGWCQPGGLEDSKRYVEARSLVEISGSSGGSVQALKKVDMLAQSNVVSITAF